MREERRKKRRLKTWVINVIMFVMMWVFIEVCYKYQLIGVFGNSIDVTRLVILLPIYEILKLTIKEALKREEER